MITIEPNIFFIILDCLRDLPDRTELRYQLVEIYRVLTPTLKFITFSASRNTNKVLCQLFT